MSQSRRYVRRFVLLLALFCLLPVGASSRLANPAAARPLPARERLAQAALDVAAQRSGLPAGELRVVGSAQARYPLQGLNAYNFTVITKNASASFQVTLDESGRELSGARLAAQERAAREAKYGRLEPRLFAALEAAAPEAPVEVIVWVKEPPLPPGQRPNPHAAFGQAQLDQLLAQNDQRLRRSVQGVVPAVERRLAQLDPQVTGDPFAPVLYARLTPQQIREVGRWPQVDQIYLNGTNQPELNVARHTVGAHIVNTAAPAGRGMTGLGVKIAQVEAGGRLPAANPHLTGVITDTTFVCAAASDHSTGVAGIMRSSHTTFRGIAPDAQLWAGGSCAGTDAQFQAQSTTAVTWGARALNLSWGSDTALTFDANDRFYDRMAGERFMTIVKSAGNNGGGCGTATNNVTSPGLAYNVITVGNVNDQNTADWSDDAMRPCSSFLNPNSTNGDREKPELSAPGSVITSTISAAPWIGDIGSGTSFAAPIVNGGAALLMQRESTLRVWPELVKAILMTTAVHNIEGARRLSDIDGAGSVNLDKADDLADRTDISDGNYQGLRYECASAPASSDVTTMTLTAGLTFRAAIVWTANVNDANYPNQPSADLDLHIIAPGGALQTSSVSLDNNYEIVEFVPAVSGVYTLRVVKTRCDSDPPWLGWAWRQQKRVAVPWVSLNDIDGAPLQYLSAAPHTYFGGNTRVHGTLLVEGVQGDTLQSLALQVVQGGTVVATGTLAATPTATLLTAFGPTERLEITTPQLLFEIPSAQLGAINSASNGTLTLRVRARTTAGGEAIKEFGQVQILTRYTGANRFGTNRDEDLGGDDWIRPSIVPVLAHYGTLGVPVSWNDLSNMNGGNFPPFPLGLNQTGVDANGYYAGYELRNATSAQRMIALLNDPTYGSRISRVYVAYTKSTTNAFWNAIRTVTLSDGRKAGDVIIPNTRYTSIFAWTITP